MRFLTGLGFAILIGPVADAAEPPPLDQRQFAKLFAVIKPDRQTEAWQQIPWQASLWEARQHAAKAGKPILLWEMDGHPLGCV